MNEAEVIRALETLNARTIELRTSAVYAAGTRKKNLDRLLADKSLTGLRRIIKEFQTFRRFSKAPRHPELPNLTPEEWEASLRPGSGDKRVVVYSCIVGNYDKPLPPIYQAPNLSYVLVTDSTEPVEGWEVWPLPEAAVRQGNKTAANRYVKFHPHELFADSYDASVYIDGNIQPISDLSYYVDQIDPAAGIGLHYHRVRDSIADEVIACKALGKGDPAKMDAQVARYVSEGYPLEFGILECNVIACDLASDLSCAIFADWWDEYERAGSGRDQLALPYVLWKHGVALDAAATMGRNAYSDTKIHIASHV